MRFVKFFSSYLITLIVSFLCSNADVFAGTRILILPFAVQSDTDLSFLQKGISQMLISRLSSDETIEIMSLDSRQQPTKSLDETAAFSTASTMKADFVSYGTITVTHDGVQTEARLLRIADKSFPVIFNRSGKNQGEALHHVKLYAAEIMKAIGAKAPVSVPSLSSQTQQQASAEESHRHPDTLWTGEIASGSTPIRMMTSDGKTEAAVWKSTRYRSEIKSLAVGDILGDKQNQLVIINDTSVSLYRYVDGKLDLIEEISSEVDHTPIRVDVADINENGRAEIFVTNLYHDRTYLRSYVLEWDGTKLVRIAQNLNWYFKVIPVVGNKPVLIGQQRDMMSLFSKGIFQLTWTNGSYIESSMTDSPRGLPIYAFSTGNILNDGTQKTIALTSDLRLRVFDPNGEMEWTSAERFTGGGVYMPYPPEVNDTKSSNELRNKRYYLPQRIIVFDIDNDGNNEVIFLNNKDYARNLLPNLRIFKSGHIECLQWDELAFASKWRTTEVSGQITDMIVGDLNNDGIAEIVYSVVDIPGSAFNSARSYLVSWQIAK